MTERTSISLCASDVLNKHGFDGGDIFDEVLEENGFAILSEREFENEAGEKDSEFLSHVVLTEIVARRLNGILPEDALRTRMSRVHNPVRAEDTEENRHLLADVVFEVQISEIIEEARGIAPEFGHGINPGL